MIHSEMYKIALIIPYFGEFPVWMDLFFPVVDGIIIYLVISL